MQPVISVTQLVELLNQTFSTVLPSIVVEGEVSGYRLWNGRLYFFDLKDDAAAINCMLPASSADIPLEDGMKVRIVAAPTVTRKGRLSIRVLRLEPIGEGAISRAFELLKQKLEGEGLFDVERKRALPELPSHIGVVTSLESAAYKDFTKVLSQRFGGLELTAVHTQVQGGEAPKQIVAAIDYFNQLSSPPEVVVLTRGGGGPEDLAAFNVESVVRAVAGSRVPIITAVGHEVDTTLVDFAADIRAATPTDAAQRVVPDRKEMLGEVARLAKDLSKNIGRQVVSAGDEVVELIAELEQARAHFLTQEAERLDSWRRILDSYDPRAVLRRGYAILRRDNQLIKTARQVNIGDSLVIQLAKGQITSEVIDVEKN